MSMGTDYRPSEPVVLRGMPDDSDADATALLFANHQMLVAALEEITKLRQDIDKHLKYCPHVPASEKE